MTFIVLFRFYYLIRLFFKNFWTVACVTFGVLLSCVIVFYNGNWSKQCWLIEDRLSTMRKSDLLQTFHRMLKENKFCDTTVLFIQYFTLQLLKTNKCISTFHRLLLFTDSLLFGIKEEIKKEVINRACLYIAFIFTYDPVMQGSNFMVHLV